MANQLTVNIDNGSVNEGVRYSSISRTGFLASNSLFDSFDLVWSHTGAANSMLGGKFQILGESRSQKGSGHRAAIGALFGANDHETDGRNSVEFSLSGKEYLFLYGYRFTEIILVYSSLSLASYEFSGVVHSSNSVTNGLKPSLTTRVNSLNTGFEFSFNSLFAKLEGSYQQLTTSDTKRKENFVFGYSLGYSW